MTFVQATTGGGTRLVKYLLAHQDARDTVEDFSEVLRRAAPIQLYSSTQLVGWTPAGTTPDTNYWDGGSTPIYRTVPAGLCTPVEASRLTV